MKILMNDLSKFPAKVWASDIDEATTDQILSMTQLPFLYKHLAVMPDAHWGCGSTVGTVIATKDAIIPGSMGAKSFIVQGLGNPESFCSCSHGAGRKHGRNAARKLFTLDDLAIQTAGVECRKDDGVLDEIPSAYKNIDKVMADQVDLVKPLYELKQILCIKG